MKKVIFILVLFLLLIILYFINFDKEPEIIEVEKEDVIKVIPEINLKKLLETKKEGKKLEKKEQINVYIYEQNILEEDFEEDLLIQEGGSFEVELSIQELEEDISEIMEYFEFQDEQSLEQIIYDIEQDLDI